MSLDYLKSRFLWGGYSLSQEYAWKKRRDELEQEHRISAKTLGGDT